MRLVQEGDAVGGESGAQRQTEPEVCCPAGEAEEGGAHAACRSGIGTHERRGFTIGSAELAAQSAKEIDEEDELFVGLLDVFGFELSKADMALLAAATLPAPTPGDCDVP